MLSLLVSYLLFYSNNSHKKNNKKTQAFFRARALLERKEGTHTAIPTATLQFGAEANNLSHSLFLTASTQSVKSLLTCKEGAFFRETRGA